MSAASSSSYDPSEDEEPRKPTKKRPARRNDRPRKPRTWVPVDEYDEPIPLDATQLTKLRGRAENLCIWHLGQGPRTRKQLLDAMTKKGVPVDMAEGVLDKLEGYNYINDAEFADNYVRSRHGSQHKGASVIRYDLRRKGVDDQTIAEALEQVTPESELDNARMLVAKKLPSTRSLERQKRVNRLVGMLARKGYGPGVAFQVVRDAIDVEDREDEDLEES